MSYPEWNPKVSDKELIEEFYKELLQRYPELTEEVEENEGLLHIDMGALQTLAEDLCAERKLNDVRECFKWVNSYFIRSKHELQNAINVSFLENFQFSRGLTEEEFKELMPPVLYLGYTKMMEYMENIAREVNAHLAKKKPDFKFEPRQK